MLVIKKKLIFFFTTVVLKYMTIWFSINNKIPIFLKDFFY